MQLDTATVFSLCQPRPATEFSKVHEAIEFLAGAPVWTHQIPRVFKGLRPHLESLFPWAFSEDAIQANERIAIASDAEVPTEELMSIITSEMERLSEKYGRTHTATEIADPTSIYRNAMAEAEEMFPGKVIPVEVSDGE